MTVPSKQASKFSHRLGELIATDAEDPEVFIAQAIESSIDEDGRGQYTETGAEAILILRGPVADRQQALRHLLATLESQL